MARMALVALGSMGDVFPVLGIADALRRCGHGTTVITTHNFAQHVREVGAVHLPVGEPGAYDRTLQQLDVRRRWRVLSTGIDNLLSKIQPVYDAITELRPDHVIANSLSLGAVVAAQRHAIPLTSVVSQTVLARSVTSPARMRLSDIAEAPSPRTVRRRHWLTDVALDVALAPGINRFRRTVGLPPISWRRDPWWFLSPTRILLTWPDWFAPASSGWPAHAVHLGFVMHDAPSLRRSQPGLPARFLVFTPGSWTTHARHFFDTAIDVSRRLSVPAVLLTEHRNQLLPSLPDHVVHVGYAALSQLLPTSAAIIHHGGPGTAAHGLAAGIPQLTLPQMFDQFDNTFHLQRLGVGTTVAEPRYGHLDAAALSLALERLLSSETVRSACAKHAALMRASIDGLDARVALQFGAPV